MLYGREFFLDTADHLMAVFTLEHHHYPSDGIHLAIVG